MDGNIKADKEMNDSTRKAQAIVDLEYDSPRDPRMQAVLDEYRSGKITYKEFVDRTVETAKEIHG